MFFLPTDAALPSLHLKFSMHPSPSTRSLRSLLVVFVSLALLVACAGKRGDAVGGTDTLFSATLIGPGGGTAVSADGIVQLLFPAGALDAEQEITITRVAEEDMSPDMALLSPNGLYDLGPDGLAFLQPVTVSIDLGEPTAIPGGGMELNVPRLLHESGGVISPMTGGTLAADPDSAVFSVPIQHFSNVGWVTGGDETATIAAEYPLALIEGNENRADFSFVADGGPFVTSMTFDKWTPTFEGMYGAVLPGYLPSESDISYGLSCLGSGSGTCVMSADYDFSLADMPANAHTVQLTFEVDTMDCGDGGGGGEGGGSTGITQETFIDLGGLGITLPDSLSYSDLNCTTSEPGNFLYVTGIDGHWVLDADAGSVLHEQYMQWEEGFFFLPTTSTDGLIDTAVFGSGIRRTTFSEGPGCLETLLDEAAGIFDLQYRDPGDPSRGTVETPWFDKFMVLSWVDATGTVQETRIGTSDFANTAVSNRAGDQSLYVTYSPQLLMHIVGDSAVAAENTETEVMPLNGYVPRMRWDPSTGLLAALNTTLNVVEILHWSGDGAPTHIAQVGLPGGTQAIDVFGSRVLAVGSTEDTYMLIEVDVFGNLIVSADTQPLPFQAPMGTSGLGASDARFLRDGNHSIGFTFKEVNGLGLIPYAF